jgi:hypothetical protein
LIYPNRTIWSKFNASFNNTKHFCPFAVIFIVVLNKIDFLSVFPGNIVCHTVFFRSIFPGDNFSLNQKNCWGKIDDEKLTIYHKIKPNYQFLDRNHRRNLIVLIFKIGIIKTQQLDQLSAVSQIFFNEMMMKHVSTKILCLYYLDNVFQTYFCSLIPNLFWLFSSTSGFRILR